MTPHQETTVDSSAASSSSDLDKVERRRTQSRTRQLRYLQKKRQHENGLSASVESLQSEVRKMQLHLSTLQLGESHPCSCPISANSSLSPPTKTPTANFLQTARDLVHCFRSGFATTEHAPWMPCASPAQEQIRFVQQAIHPDVVHGELRGQNLFLEQWRRYTSFFRSFALRPNSFKLLSPGTGHVVCRVQLTLSLGLVAGTFQNVFPHLLRHQHSRILNRLHNQQIHVPTTLQLQFDALGRVCSYDSSPNFVHALHQLLANYADVVIVLQDANISACGHIGNNVSTNSNSSSNSSTSPRDARLALSFVLSPIE